MSEDPLFEADDAATPLTAEERQGLIPSYITLRSELNEAEQINVTTAEQAAFARKRNVLDEHYLRRLHQEHVPRCLEVGRRIQKVRAEYWCRSLSHLG